MPALTEVTLACRVSCRALPGEEALGFFEEGFALGVSFVSGELGEFFELVAKLPGQPRGHFDKDAHEQVAVAVAVNVGHALVAHAEHGAGLSARRDLQPRRAAQRRHVDLAAERRGGKVDWHLAQQIVALADEQIVRPHVHDDVEIAVWSAGVFTIEGLTAPTEAWSTTTVDVIWSGGDWRLYSIASTPGPVPAAPQAPGT